MKTIDYDQLANMKPRFRANFINSLSGFKSANLIGTKSKNGINNLAIFSSVFHIGASPALVGFVSRPNTVERNTLENIKHTKMYTINHVNEGIWQSGHQTSARYNSDECEFEKTNLTPYFINGVAVPFVKESRLKYMVTLTELVPITLNNTVIVIGEISNTICPQSAIKSDGYIDIESLKTVAVSGLDSYHKSNRLSRLSYAKPDRMCTKVGLDGIAK